MSDEGDIDYMLGMAWYMLGIAWGVETELERCAKIAEAEPECPGPMPDELYLVPLEEVIRAAVRATKKNIAAAIRKQTDE